MTSRERMIRISTLSQFMTYHARLSIETADESEEHKHRQSIIRCQHDIEAILQNRSQSTPEPWLTLFEIQTRLNACLNGSKISDIDYHEDYF